MTKLPISTRSAANNPLRPTHVCHHLHKLGKKLKSKDLGSVVPDYDDAVGLLRAVVQTHPSDEPFDAAPLRKDVSHALRKMLPGRGSSPLYSLFAGPYLFDAAILQNIDESDVLRLGVVIADSMHEASSRSERAFEAHIETYASATLARHPCSAVIVCIAGGEMTVLLATVRVEFGSGRFYHVMERAADLGRPWMATHLQLDDVVSQMQHIFSHLNDTVGELLTKTDPGAPRAPCWFLDPHFSSIEGHVMSCTDFRPAHVYGPCDSAVWRCTKGQDVIVKVCWVLNWQVMSHYNEETHRTLAQAGMAPVLMDLVTLEDGWKVATMEAFECDLESFLFRTPGRKPSKFFSPLMDFLERVRSELNNNLMVHGDIHPRHVVMNVTIEDDVAIPRDWRLIGFDMSGKGGQDRYPLDLLLSKVADSPDTRRAGEVLKERDDKKKVRALLLLTKNVIEGKT